MISGWVRVIGPSSDLAAEQGTTEPEPSTLPKRTMEKRVPVASAARPAPPIRPNAGRSHHIGGVHGFVGGNQHHLSHAGGDCGATHLIGGPHVVSQTGQGIGLHQGDVLIQPWNTSCTA